MKKFLLAVCVFCLSAFAAHADSGGTTYYNVTGTMSITGNAACGYCVETVNFSFLAEQFELAPGGSYVFAAVSPISFTDSGPFNFTNGSLVPGQNAVEFWNSAYQFDEMDFNFDYGYSDTSALPVAINSNFYFCESATCGTDFSIYGTPFSGGIDSDYGTATWTITPIVTPEPSELALLLPALLGMPLIGRRRRSERPQTSSAE